MSNWAQRGKEALASVTAVPEGMTVRNGREELEPIEFLCYSQPRNPASKSVVFTVGSTFTGKYEGSVIEKDATGKTVVDQYGKTKYRFHKLRGEDGKLKGFSSTAALNNELPKIAEGTKVFIQRVEGAITKTGPNAGKPQNSFKIAY